MYVIFKSTEINLWSFSFYNDLHVLYPLRNCQRVVYSWKFSYWLWKYAKQIISQLFDEKISFLLNSLVGFKLPYHWLLDYPLTITWWILNAYVGLYLLHHFDFGWKIISSLCIESLSPIVRETFSQVVVILSLDIEYQDCTM